MQLVNICLQLLGACFPLKYPIRLAASTVNVEISTNFFIAATAFSLTDAKDNIWLDIVNK